MVSSNWGELFSSFVSVLFNGTVVVGTFALSLGPSLTENSNGLTEAEYIMNGTSTTICLESQSPAARQQMERIITEEGFILVPDCLYPHDLRLEIRKREDRVGQESTQVFISVDLFRSGGDVSIDHVDRQSRPYYRFEDQRLRTEEAVIMINQIFRHNREAYAILLEENAGA